MVHHNNCTYCKHRVVYKAKKSGGELEKCGLTWLTIKHPLARGLRYCDKYQQKNCDCEQCNLNITVVKD